MDMMKVGRGGGGLIIYFPCNPDYISKVKATKRYRWHPDGEKSLSREMYRRSSSDIPPKRKDMRSSYIPLNGKDLRSTSYMKELYEIKLKTKREVEK